MRFYASTFSRLVLVLVVALSSFYLYSSPAHADRPADRRDAGVGLISAGSAGLAATGVGAPVAAFGFGFQIGWGIGCILFDPPDTANALIPVDVDDFLQFQFPAASVLDPSFDSALGSALDTYMDTLDGIVAFSRAVRASLDRHEGALILGETVAAQLRLQEAEAFQQALVERVELGQEGFSSVISAFDQFDSNILDTLVTQQDLIDIRDDAVNDILPSGEQTALDAWQVTTEERTLLLSQLGSVPDTLIADFFFDLDSQNGISTTVRDGWISSIDTIAISHVVPEPSSILLLAMGLILLIGIHWRSRRRRAHPVFAITS